MSHKNYYSVLCVEPSASAEEIRKAFRALAKKYHPDRAGDTNTTNFQEINEAYETLSSPLKRKRHDAELHIRETMKKAARGKTGEFAPGTLREEAAARLRPRGASVMPEIMEVFNAFFEDRSGRTRREYIDATAVLTDEEARRGLNVETDIPLQVDCPLCRGKGNEWTLPCYRCRGTGRVPSTRRVSFSIPPMTGRSTVLEIPVFTGIGAVQYLRVYVSVE